MFFSAFSDNFTLFVLLNGVVVLKKLILEVGDLDEPGIDGSVDERGL